MICIILTTRVLVKLKQKRDTQSDNDDLDQQTWNPDSPPTLRFAPQRYPDQNEEPKSQHVLYKRDALCVCDVWELKRVSKQVWERSGLREREREEERSESAPSGRAEEENRYSAFTKRLWNSPRRPPWGADVAVTPNRRVTKTLSSVMSYSRPKPSENFPDGGHAAPNFKYKVFIIFFKINGSETKRFTIWFLLKNMNWIQNSDKVSIYSPL